MNLFVNEVSGTPHFLNSDALVATSNRVTTAEQLRFQIETLVNQGVRNQAEKDRKFTNDPVKIIDAVSSSGEIQKAQNFLNFANDDVVKSIGENAFVTETTKTITEKIWKNAIYVDCSDSVKIKYSAPINRLVDQTVTLAGRQIIYSLLKDKTDIITEEYVNRVIPEFLKIWGLVLQINEEDSTFLSNVKKAITLNAYKDFKQLMDENAEADKEILTVYYEKNDLIGGKEKLMEAFRSSGLFEEEKNTGILVFKFQTEPDFQELQTLIRNRVLTATGVGQISSNDTRTLNYLLDSASKFLAKSGNLTQLIESSVESNSPSLRFTASSINGTERLIKLIYESSFITNLKKEYTQKIKKNRENFQNDLSSDIDLEENDDNNESPFKKEENRLKKEFKTLRNLYVGTQLLETKRAGPKNDKILIPNQYIGILMNVMNSFYLKSVLYINGISLTIRELIELSLADTWSQTQRKNFFVESITYFNIGSAILLNVALLFGGFYTYNLAELQSGASMNVASAIAATTAFQIIPSLLQTADYFKYLTPLTWIAGLDAAGFLPFVIQNGI